MFRIWNLHRAVLFNFSTGYVKDSSRVTYLKQNKVIISNKSAGELVLGGALITTCGVAWDSAHTAH